MAFSEMALNRVYAHTAASRVLIWWDTSAAVNENLWRIHRRASQAFCRRVAGRP
jgi:hypothetical protein